MMPKRPHGYWDYVVAAFRAKPSWLWLPPNWIGLAACAALGFANPGIWLLGAGLELAYLHFLSSHEGFRRWVRDRQAGSAPPPPPGPLRSALAHLQPDEREAFLTLQRRSREMLAALERQARAPEAVGSQREAMEQLLWIAMRLLQTKSNLDRYFETQTGHAEEADEVRDQLQAPTLSEPLRSSLEGRLRLLEQRAAAADAMRERLAFIESEIARTGHQIELIGEQALLTTQSTDASSGLDSVAATVESANRFLADHQRVYGVVADLLETPPSLLDAPSPSQPPPLATS